MKKIASTSTIALLVALSAHASLPADIRPDEDSCKIEELEQILKYSCAPPIVFGDITDIISGLYEWEGVDYISNNTWKLLAWISGKSPTPEYMAERNSKVFQKPEYTSIPLLPLNTLPYLSPEEGMVRFSYYCNPITVLRPAEIEGYIFHMDRPIRPWDKLIKAPTDEENKQSIAQYLEYFAIDQFPLAFRSELNYMEEQKKAQKQKRKRDETSEQDEISEQDEKKDDEEKAYSAYYSAFNPELSINYYSDDEFDNPKDKTLYEIYKTFKENGESAEEKLVFYLSLLDDPEISSYNYIISVKKLISLLSENYH